jgi:hypothetical protein
MGVKGTAAVAQRPHGGDMVVMAVCLGGEMGGLVCKCDG